LCLCCGLCIAAPLWAQEAAVAPDLSVPDIDVADSVRRMLEAARTQGGQVEDAAESGVAGAAAPVPDPAPASAPVPAASRAAPAPAPAATPPAAAAQRQAPASSDHVPLPEREFTIRGADDIRALARELEEAKQRQRRRE
jgi:hypothetical protein